MARKGSLPESDYRDEADRVRSVSLPVVLIAILGVGISLVIGWLAFAEHRGELAQTLQRQAEGATSRLREDYLVNQETLYSIGSFFRSSEQITRKEFSTFVGRTFEREGVVTGLGWIPMVAQSRRDEFTKRARDEGLSDFEFKEWNKARKFVSARKRNQYAPIYYAEPMATNHGVLGFDLLMHEPRKIALEKAIDVGQPVATDPVGTVSSGGEESALIVYLPIYSADPSPEKMEDRRKSIRGFISTKINLSRLVAHAVEELDLGVTWELRDGSQADGEAIYRHGLEPTEAERQRAVHHTLHMGNRDWSMAFIPTAEFYAARPNLKMWLSVCICLAFTTVVCAWIHSLASRQVRVENIVNDRTSELVIANSALKKENKERRSAEKQIVEKTSALEEANKELESFSYSISHDLRAPLRAIIGFTGFVLKNNREALPDDAVNQLEQVKKGGERMNELIDGLLEFSRVQRSALKPRNCDFGEMARKILSELQTTMPEKPVDVIWGKLPTAYGDPTLLRQVWQNLISNALKYSGNKDDSLIEIGSRTEAGQAVYYVKDNGAGFDMKQYDRLFGVFQRMHSQTQFEGTGIGLATIHKIVQRHGGRIWAEAVVDEGATFFFTLGTLKADPDDSAMLDVVKPSA